MSTSQSLELYFYCDDGPSMWVWWLKINPLKEHTLNQQQCGTEGKRNKNIIMVVGCPSGPPDYKDVTKEHNKGEKKSMFTFIYKYICESRLQKSDSN